MINENGGKRLFQPIRNQGESLEKYSGNMQAANWQMSGRMPLEQMNMRPNPVEQLQEISEHVGQLEQALMQNSYALLQSVEANYAKLERRYQAKKPRRVAEDLFVGAGEWLQVRYTYEDDTQKNQILTKTVTGTYQVFELDFGGFEQDSYFAIWFLAEHVAVIGAKKKLRGEYLYNCFSRAGIYFGNEVPKNIAVKVLNAFFIPIIEQTRATLKIEPMPGWYNGQFITQETFPWQKTSEMPELPVFSKSFPYQKFGSEEVKLYFEFLRKIKNPEDRVWTMLIPFLGSIASLLKQEGVALDFSVNYVVMNTDMDWIAFAKCLRVFNRNENILSADLSTKELEASVRMVRDEVYLVDGVCDAEDSEYYQRKVADNSKRIAKILTGKSGVRKGKTEVREAFLTVFSSQQMPLRQVQNIFIMEDFLSPHYSIGAFLETKSLEAIFSAWIRYISREYEKSCVLIRKARSEAKGVRRILAILQDLLIGFWNSEGIDLMKEIDVPESFSFLEIIGASYDAEDLMDHFKWTSRKAVGAYRFEEKKKTQQLEAKTIYYDREYIYFQTELFRRFLQKQGLEKECAELLLQLKAKGELKTDYEGYSRRVTIAGVRAEYYCIRRSFFNEEEMIEFTELGGI